jgi:hypothetical protein
MTDLDREIAHMARDSIQMINNIREASNRIEILMLVLKDRIERGLEDTRTDWLLEEVRYVQSAIATKN